MALAAHPAICKSGSACLKNSLAVPVPLGVCAMAADAAPAAKVISFRRSIMPSAYRERAFSAGDFSRSVPGRRLGLGKRNRRAIQAFNTGRFGARQRYSNSQSDPQSASEFPPQARLVPRLSSS